MTLRKQERLASFVCFLMGMSLIVLCLTTPGCETPKIPPMNVKFWAGDSQQVSITRAQDKESIKCGDPMFDQYVCLSYDDMKVIYKTLLSCKQWDAELMTAHDTLQFIRNNPKVSARFIERPLESVQP